MLRPGLEWVGKDCLFTFLKTLLSLSLPLPWETLFFPFLDEHRSVWVSSCWVCGSLHCGSCQRLCFHSSLISAVVRVSSLSIHKNPGNQLSLCPFLSFVLQSAGREKLSVLTEKMKENSFFRECKWWTVLHDLNKNQLKLVSESESFLVLRAS